VTPIPVPAINGNDLLREATTRLGIQFSSVIAETTLWANPKVHASLLKRTGSAAWFPNTRRYKAGHEERGTVIDGIRLDDNSYANGAIKKALGCSIRQLTGFETCHIWPLTCYDTRYHTAIANLVLMPSAIASLSDYDPEVQAALQYRSYELYGWHPAEVMPPVRPASYPTNWSEPFPPPTGILKSEHAGPWSLSSANGKDHTKYSFQGETFGKNRLVHAVVSAYIQMHPDAGFEALEAVFPDSLQGKFGVIRQWTDVRCDARLLNRYFTKSGELLNCRFGAEQIVVCTQWGSFNIDKFIRQAESLGFEILPNR